MSVLRDSFAARKKQIQVARLISLLSGQRAARFTMMEIFEPMEPTTSSRLDQCRPGKYRCQAIHASGNSALRLKRMGICEGLLLELVRAGDPLIVEALGSRVGISRTIAAEISVVAAIDKREEGQIES